MFLRELSMLSFRPFESTFAKFSPHANVFFGGNGNGKTSILEAVNLLSCGKSFRAQETRKLVRHGAASLAVSGVMHTNEDINGIERVKVGVECPSSGGRTRFRLNGVDSPREVIAKSFPAQILDSASLDLIAGPPEGRRRFLDWLLFHVEPEFYPEWRRYSVALKQRNAALKSGGLRGREQDPWRKILSDAGEVVASARKEVVGFMQAELYRNDECKDLLDFTSDPIKLELVSGWESNVSLADAIAAATDRDLFRGYTSVGPHRADFNIWIGDVLAEDICSRGQLKRLMSALFISRSHVFFNLTGKRCICLIDDILAELDESSFLVLLRGALNYSGQIFITCLNLDGFLKVWTVLKENNLLKSWGSEAAWFHVEQGRIKEFDRESVLQIARQQKEAEYFIE